MAGRAHGKTRTGAEWVLSLVESGQARRIALVAPTAFDARTVMVEGESGILACAPPWNRPRYEPSRCQLVWPNGAVATTYSADCPERLRGPQSDAAWIDEVGSWRRPDAYNNLMLGLRLGQNPRLCATTTPRATELVKRLIESPDTATVRGTTFQNSTNLAPQFIDQITARFLGTRLGRQELFGELLEIIDGQWFATFDPAKHVKPHAIFHPAYGVNLAIDAGTSRHTAAVWFQLHPLDHYRTRVVVIGDFHCEGPYAAQAAALIDQKAQELPHRGKHERVRLDPAASARTGIGPAAFGEYENRFGHRITAKWPLHGVVDGLDQIETLLDTDCLWINPGCQHVISAFNNFAREERAGEFLDCPKGLQHPHEDVMDALRGGIRDAMPEGRKEAPQFRTINASKLF
jgi:hypothetical protein